jgi:glycosyltransferase involved in cell wall biosynthesis
VRKNLNRAAAVHFTAEMEHELTRPLGLTAPPLIEPNGIPLDEFASLPPAGAFRARRGIAAGRPVVLFLGRVHPKKGLDLLLPAFAAGAPREALLVVAGPVEAEYRAKLDAVADAAGIADRVLWTGMLHGRERIEAMVDADLFALPSHQENFGIAVVETMASGRPVLISDKVNIWQQVTSAGAGEALPLDERRWSAALGAWMTDDARRARAGAAARAAALDLYDWDHIARRWGGHYARIAAARGGKRGGH